MDTETASLRHLLQVAPRLGASLDPERVLHEAIEVAREITGARSAGIVVQNPEGTGMSRFLSAGAGLPDLTDSRAASIVMGGEVWADLVVADKAGGAPFTRTDEDAIAVLVRFVAVALDNAHRYRAAELEREQSAHALRALEAARAISDSIGTKADLGTILQMIVKRGRALVDARGVIILLVNGDRMEVAAGTGTTGDGRGLFWNVDGSLSGQVLADGVPLRLNVPAGQRNVLERLGLDDVRTALFVPMIHRGKAIGVLNAVDRGLERGPFSDADENVLHTFASAAANAVAISRRVESDRLRAAIAAAEAERRRWARELHDQTLQSLGGLRVLLSGARRKDDLGVFRERVSAAMGDLEAEIQGLRAIIADLRPPLLDDLGLVDALDALADRHRDRGLPTLLRVDLTGPDGAERRLSAALETTVYRLVQEAVSNVVKHAGARTVSIDAVVGDHDVLVIEVRDDGHGFDPASDSRGFGMSGMAERAYLAGGSLDVTSGPEGTHVRFELPATFAPARADPVPGVPAAS